MDLTPEVVFSLVQSGNQFPIDLDDAWLWIGWTTKQQAKDLLLNSFVGELDFLRKGLKSSSGGRPSEWIVLTVDCFKSLAMMAGTARGKEVRKYFLECETKLKKLLSTGSPSALDYQMVAWQKRHDIRVYLKDFLRAELMDAVVAYAQSHGKSPITLASSVHDVMNERIQGHQANHLKKIGCLSKRAMLRDYFEAPPLVDYSAINRLARNGIQDRALEPVQAVHEACDFYLGKEYVPKVVPIAENLYKQERRLQAVKQQKRLNTGIQLSLLEGFAF